MKRKVVSGIVMMLFLASILSIWVQPIPRARSINDLEIVALALGSYPGHPNWNPDVDINNDGIIDIKDLVLIADAPSALARKILRQNFQCGWSASRLASAVDMYQVHYDALDIFPQIEAIRLDVLSLVYFNTIMVWGPGNPWEYDAERLQMFMDNGWLLLDDGGSYVMTSDGAAYYIDFGNPDYHTWLAGWYKGYMDQYGLDGASLDNWFVNSAVWYYTWQNPINPRTGTYWTDQEICDAFKAMTLRIRQIIGSDKIILVNGVYNGNHFFGSQTLFADGILNGGVDAVMSEGWISSYDASAWYSEDVWKKGIDFAVWMEDNFPAKNGRYFMFIHADNSFASFQGGGSWFPPDMTEQQYQQYVTYGYASRLLTVKQLTSIISFCDYIEYDYAQSLFEIDIGTPSESYHTLGASHVYARTFSGGMVLVNPTYDYYTVTVGSGYKDAVTGGSVSSTLTVQPHTGIILSTA